MSPAPRFTRADPDVRRAALIEAAAASLSERGAGGASVRDVAARAGVSPGLIRHHFGGFSALMAQTYREVVARVDASLDAAVAAAGDDPRSRLLAFLEASFAPGIVDADLLGAWLGFWGLVRTDPDAAAVHAETYVAYRIRLEELLAPLGVEDVRGAAIGLSALLDGLWLELCLDADAFTRDEAVALCRRWVEGD